MDVLYLANDNLVQIVGLQDVAAPATEYINSATVVCTIRDSAGNAVAGATNIPCQYQGGSNGIYNGVVEDTVTLVEGAYYTAVIDASSGGLKGHWEVPCRAAIRRK
jgi:hypothetical protein